MAKRTFKAGATSQTVDVFIMDSSSTIGAGLAGLVFNTANLKAYYRKGATGAATAITLATQTVGGAWSSGGFVEVDAVNMKGVYRLDVPDTVFAASPWATLYLYGATNMTPVVLELEIVAYDPFDAVRCGLTALPNAAAEAVGGLYTRGSGAGQINQNTNGQIDGRTVAMANDVVTAVAVATDAVTEIQSGLATAANLAIVAGYVDTEIGTIITNVAAVKTDTAAIKAKTDSLTFTKANELDVNLQSVNDVTVTGNGSAGTPWGP